MPTLKIIRADGTEEIHHAPVRRSYSPEEILAFPELREDSHAIACSALHSVPRRSTAKELEEQHKKRAAKARAGRKGKGKGKVKKRAR